MRCDPAAGRRKCHCSNVCPSFGDARARQHDLVQWPSFQEIKFFRSDFRALEFQLSSRIEKHTPYGFNEEDH